MLCLFSRDALLPRAQTVQESGTPCCQVDKAAPREVDFPYYSLRDGFNSNLLLVGASPKPTDFVVAVHALSGRTLLSPTLTIQSGEKRSLDLRAFLNELGADVNGDFAEGSVAVYFNGTVMPLPGQLTLSNPARGLSLESEMVDNSPGLGLLPAALNALWWGLGGGRDAKIMVSNTSGDSVTADVFLDFQGERHASAPLSLSPHETKVLSVIQLLGELRASPAQAPQGGITIVGRGAKAVLIAQGKITDASTGFSTSLNFMDPALQKASAMHASGVPIGLPSKDSPYTGTGVFIPHVIVRNLAGSPQSASITLEYPGDKEPQQVRLAPIPLGAYATEDLALDSAFGLLPLPLPFCSIRIQYSGPPGSAIGEVSSVESKGDLVIDSRLANERDGWAGAGGHPWHLDEETESIMFLTNMGDRPARIGFDVVALATHYYLTKLKLQPHETRAIDLRKLRDAQKPDFKRNTIPPEASDGSVIWSRLDHVPVMGRLVVLERHKGMSSNYDCGICDCPAAYVDLEVEPYSVVTNQGGYAYLDAEAKFDEYCNSYYWWCSVPASRTSLNPSVATVDEWGDIRGVSGGSASIKATYSDCYYTFDSQT